MIKLLIITIICNFSKCDGENIEWVLNYLCPFPNFRWENKECDISKEKYGIGQTMQIMRVKKKQVISLEYGLKRLIIEIIHQGA